MRQYKLATLAKIVALTFVASCASHANHNNLGHQYARFDSFSYSEPTPIYSALNEWDGKLGAGEQVFSYNWFEYGINFEKWRIAALYRYDAAFDFSPDTAAYYHALANNLETDGNREYELDLKGLQYLGSGVRMGVKQRAAKRMHLEWGLSLFQAEELIDGHLTGNNREAQIDYHYSTDVLFEQPAEKPEGFGASVDLMFDWTPDADYHIYGQITDLLGYIRWVNVPHTQAIATADNTIPRSRQTRLGQETVLSHPADKEEVYLQALSPRLNATISRKLNTNLAIQLDYLHQNEQDFKGLGFTYNLAGRILGIHYWPAVQSTELSLGYPGWRVSLATNKPDWESTASLWLRFTLD